MEGAAQSWPMIGLILAGELLFALAMAALVRVLSKHQLHGQTYWMVVMGVAGVVVIAGEFIGWLNVAFLLACLSVAGFVMGVEYYDRLLREQREAQQAREELVK